jgi:hypothetical protein
MAAGQTLTEAAASAKCDRKTLYRWRAEDIGFQQALALAQHQIYADTIAGIVAGSLEAISALRAIASDEKKPTSARVSAALGILNHAHQNYRVAFLEGRMDQLEEILNETE